MVPGPSAIERKYDIKEWRNAFAVLSAAHPDEWRDILAVLSSFRLLKGDVAAPGGRKSPVAEKLDSHFYQLGWKEKGFKTSIMVDDAEFATPTHKLDCYKNRVALEVDWKIKTRFLIVISIISGCCSNCGP